MNFNELKYKSIPHFYAIKIDALLSQRKRKLIRMALAIFALLSFSFSFDSSPLHFGSADGFFFVLLIAFLVLFLLELFYRSMVGQGFDPSLKLDYALSQIVFYTDDIDASRALFESKVGLSVLGRLGLPREISQKFIYENRLPVVASSFEFASQNPNLPEYFSLLYEADKFLQKFLSENNITKQMLLSAASEVSKSTLRRIDRQRFWTKENLGAIPSLGSNPFFEIAYSKKGASQFLASVPFSELDIYSIKADEEVSRLEHLLASQANVVIISENTEKVEQKVRALHKKIALGVVGGELEHKKLFSLDIKKLFDLLSPSEYEREFAKMFSNDGLVERVVYISDFASLLLRFREVRIDPSKAILGRGALLIVCINSSDYKFLVETHKSLSQKFSIISIS